MLLLTATTRGGFFYLDITHVWPHEVYLRCGRQKARGHVSFSVTLFNFLKTTEINLIQYFRLIMNMDEGFGYVVSLITLSSSILSISVLTVLNKSGEIG